MMRNTYGFDSVYAGINRSSVMVNDQMIVDFDGIRIELDTVMYYLDINFRIREVFAINPKEEIPVEHKRIGNSYYFPTVGMRSDDVSQLVRTALDTLKQETEEAVFRETGVNINIPECDFKIRLVRNGV